MKVLAVGYACNPYGGSEQAVGWNAVRRIARHHDVWVLTDDHNRAGWTKATAEGLVPANVTVRFLREAKDSPPNRFIAHVQSWLNYADFTRKVLAEARAWHEEIGFDLCHQVTIASWRMPSPLWQLPVPFVWGPVGGAGHIPKAFRTILSPSARAFEFARDFSNRSAMRSRAFRDCVEKAAVVIAANEETEELLKPFRKVAPMIRLPVTTLAQESIARLTSGHPVPDASGPLRMFAGGNMEGRKGVALALRAVAGAVAKGIPVHYTIAGGGPEIPSLQGLAASLGITQHVEFHPGFSGDDYVRALQGSDVYFLPSFRETMGMTLVEAILAGCYPVVADTSAQGEIVRMAGGIAVPVQSVDGLVAGLTEAIVWCHGHRAELPEKTRAIAARITEYLSYDRTDQALEHAYRESVVSQVKS
ncbi:glycosyltransferase family 4 protein [Luteolibacter flavescens]|uniref:Glycosyltransferase family 4 protein n=1 Tax=Luteolibacter flavescens TaxID=1859460 RepID=A0ABT3FQA4_9BACT|nr:glycosyltransferase family 4 protein [Luteolibacter flavescens]MCW1885160.1 glycosyltransferase family 4 protein [Luteolibacter flavescens]